MFTLMRSSLFISLMLIVSITLSGCSVDFGAIFSGLKNVIGSISQGLGGFIEKGVTFAKDFIGKAKDFVAPIIEKGKEVYGKIAPIAEKVKDGIDKVQNVVNKVSDAGNAITDFGKKMTEGGNDAVGNKIDTTAATNEVVADPDNEESVITIKPATASATVNATATRELMTPQERETATRQVTASVNQVSSAIDTLAKNIKQLKVSDAERKAAEEKIRKLRDNMKQILKDPTSKDAQALLKATQTDANSLAGTAKKYADIAKGTVDSLSSVVKSFDSSFKSISNAISSFKK